MEEDEGDRASIVIERKSAWRGAYVLQSKQRLPRPREVVFAFFADAHRLESITPDWLQFEVTNPGPIEMREGAEIDYRLRVHGIGLRWKSRITVWEPPERFVDEQIVGPYRYWRHEHRFDAGGDETLVTDTVEYGVPGGAIVHALFVGCDVKRIFCCRQSRLLEEFGAGAPTGSSSHATAVADAKGVGVGDE